MILEAAPFAILVVDSERLVWEINDAGAKLAGRPPEDLVGLRGGDALRCLHALDSPLGCGFGEACERCVVRNTVLSTIKTGQRHDGVEAQMTLGLLGDQAKRTLLLYTAPLDTPESQRVLVILVDITERKKAEEERREIEKCRI